MVLGRNDDCWCGSGKKYKKCHMEYDEMLKKYEDEGFFVPPRSWIKTEEQIDGIRRSGIITHGLLAELGNIIRPGISTQEIDDFVYRYTVEHGGVPATLGYNGFPKSCCTSINEVVCHGIPDREVFLSDGDIVNVDITTILDGFYSDSSRMYPVGNVGERGRKIMKVALECLETGIERVKPLSDLNDIGRAVEKHAKENGCSVVRDLCGHGIGLEFHEEPQVEHYAKETKGVLMLPNMVFTIEPMINEGTWRVDFMKDDGWTVKTRDRKLSAQWEHTLRVTDTGCEILT